MRDNITQTTHIRTESVEIALELALEAALEAAEEVTLWESEVALVAAESVVADVVEGVVVSESVGPLFDPPAPPWPSLGNEGGSAAAPLVPKPGSKSGREMRFFIMRLREACSRATTAWLSESASATVATERTRARQQKSVRAALRGLETNMVVYGKDGQAARGWTQC